MNITVSPKGPEKTFPMPYETPIRQRYNVNTPDTRHPIGPTPRGFTEEPTSVVSSHKTQSESMASSMIGRLIEYFVFKYSIYMFPLARSNKSMIGKAISTWSNRS